MGVYIEITTDALLDMIADRQLSQEQSLAAEVPFGFTQDQLLRSD